MSKDFRELFHYRGQEPKRLGANKFSKLARYIDNEETMALREKYIDLYYVKEEGDSKNLQKRVPVLHCLVCSKDIRCFYSKSFSLDFKNFFTHLQSQHVTELTPIDQLKREDITGVNMQSVPSIPLSNQSSHNAINNSNVVVINPPASVDFQIVDIGGVSKNNVSKRRRKDNEFLNGISDDL